MDVHTVMTQASPFDNIWGIGFNAVDAESNYAHWGLNLLGKALMKVRRRLKEEDERSKGARE